MRRLFYFLPILLFFACNEVKVDEPIPGNQVANYQGVPTLKVENYINRMYIDLLGRVPLDAEMQRDVNTLVRNNLNFDTRDSIIRRLQRDSGFVEGDISYQHAWHQRIYELLKARFLEGSSDDIIRQRLGPNYYHISI